MRNIYEEWQRLDTLTPEEKAKEINNFPKDEKKEYFEKCEVDIFLIKKLMEECARGERSKDLTLEMVGVITSDYEWEKQ